MKPNVLVTGGAGYIGSHMVKMLRSRDYGVVVYDNLSRGHADAVVNAKLVVGDIRDKGTLVQLFRDHPIDVVMHFAALAYVGESVEHPEIYLDNNINGSRILIEAMQASKVSRLVFSSTCATYGIHDTPINERCIQNPVNPYGRTKLEIEHLLQACAKSHDLSSVSLRYFNAAGCDPDGVLGERHNPETHLIPVVLNEALRILNGRPSNLVNLSVYGTDYDTPDGTCIRDYIHVTDICHAHLKAMQQLLSATDTGAVAYNLANGQGYSILEVIESCIRVTNIPIQYRVGPRRPGDPAILIGDAQKIRTELSWSPKFTELDDIIATAWNWMSRRD